MVIYNFVGLRTFNHCFFGRIGNADRPNARAYARERIAARHICTIYRQKRRSMERLYKCLLLIANSISASTRSISAFNEARCSW